MKLYGKELDDMLKERKHYRYHRMAQGKTLRVAAKTNDMGMTFSEYCDWENGYDVCPHEEREEILGCLHPPFLIMNRCTKCGHMDIIGREEEVSEDVLEKAFTNTKRRQEEFKNLANDNEIFLE